MRKLGVPLLVLVVASFLGAQRKSFERLIQHPARGTRGAIGAGSRFAADAGMRLFHAGGNAADAGVAAMFAAAIAEYSHFGFGGEAPILIRSEDGRVFSIPGVGTMPKLASADFFRKRPLEAGEVEDLEPGGLKGMVPVAGLMPALVPGMVDAALVALSEFGTRTFAEVIQPAIELADGMPMDEIRAGTIAHSRRFFNRWPTSKRVFLPEGRLTPPGEIFRQPDLARTLREMVKKEEEARASGSSRKTAIDAVRDYFYRGSIARKIDTFSRANGGLLRYEDMVAFRLKPEEPVATDYRGVTVYKPGFWSQGPSLIEALNILEGLDLRAMRHNSADYIHALTEALKLAYADRDTYYGDPAFVKVPSGKLLSKEYAAERRDAISPRASFEFRPGAFPGIRALHPSESEIPRAHIDDALMARDTTCINTADRDGLVFSATPSGGWLPSVIAGDTGIPLTSRAQSFLLIPGHPNELAPGKRPRITLSPTLVTRNGKPYLALSTPGGDTQDQALLQILLNVVEFGMNAEAAVEAPRFQTRHLVSSFDNHAMNPGELLLDERIQQGVFEELASRGHKIARRTRWSSGAAPSMIRILGNGVLEAGADPYGHRVAWAW